MGLKMEVDNVENLDSGKLIEPVNSDKRVIVERLINVGAAGLRMNKQWIDDVVSKCPDWHRERAAELVQTILEQAVRVFEHHGLEIWRGVLNENTGQMSDQPTTSTSSQLQKYVEMKIRKVYIDQLTRTRDELRAEANSQKTELDAKEAKFDASLTKLKELTEVDD